jgi:RNA polymerase sigma factor (sigma-70 family)
MRKGPPPRRAVRPRQERNDLVVGHLGLARQLAGQWARRGRAGPAQADDLLQAACLGLLRAAELWEPGRGAPFAPYAVCWVRRSLRAHCHADRLIRVPAGAAAPQAVPLAHCPDPRAPAGPTADAEAAEALRAAVARLAPPERRVLRGLYWQGLSWADLAAQMEVSKAYLAILRNRALARLRAILGGECL